MFKEAYTQGVCDALGHLGLAKFANEDEAAQAANMVAQQLPEEPVDPVAPDATAELAANLIELSDQLEESAQQAAATAESASAVTGGGAPEAAMPPMAPPMAPEAEKMAHRIYRLRNKLSAMGATNDPDDPAQKNTPQNAARVTGEGEMDNAARPEGYANVGVQGVGTQEDSGEGAVGSEYERADQDAKAVDGSNSAIEAIKGASLNQLIRKVATMGSTLDPSDASQRNTPAQAAKVTGEGQRENTERPAGYANKGVEGVGQSDMAAKIRASAVGTEEAHASGNPVKQNGSNTVIEQIAKSAEHADYLKSFETVLSKYAHLFPATASDAQKIAAIQFLMGQGPDAREKIASLIKRAGDIPAALKAYQEGKDSDEKSEKSEEDKKEKDEEDKEDSEKKEAALRTVMHGLRELAKAR